MMVARLTLLTGLAALALVLAVPALARADVTVRHRAQLGPTDEEPKATGRALDYETFGYPFTAWLAVRVRGVSTTDMVAVLLNDEFLTTIMLKDGSGEVRMTGRLGTDVPLIRTGDTVQIVDVDDGTVLLEGVFD
jgi:hypothetical protein